jgi:hypothetical protein
VGLELMKITGGAVSMPLLHLTDRQFVQLFDFVHSRFCSNCLQTLNYLGIPATLGIHLPDGYIPLLGCWFHEGMLSAEYSTETVSRAVSPYISPLGIST